MSRPSRSFTLLLAVLFSASFAEAAMQHRIDGEIFTDLGGPVRQGAKLEVGDVPLIDDRPETLELERFDVLSPTAVIEIRQADGTKVRVAPQPLAQYRGRVAGIPESLVYMSVGKSVDGFIAIRDRKFMMTSRARAKSPRAGALAHDVFVEEVPADIEFGVDNENGFRCDIEGEAIQPLSGLVPQSLAFDAAPLAAPTGTQFTTLNMAIESDAALYANFSNNIANVETFLRNLYGAASTIYRRDLNTELRISYLGMSTTTDPWTINPGSSGTWNGTGTTFGTIHALLEYGDYWHNDPPTASRSAAMLVSGQTQTSGVAWVDNVCDTEFFAHSGYGQPYSGHYGGPYAYCGGVGVSANDRVVPDPDANPNFGSPSFGYWPLLQISHELGHTVQSGHTHCIAVSPATWGRSFVDNCYAAQAGCYAGGTSIPAEKGTIMSYCHLFGGSQTRFTFGQDAEASETVITNMRTALDAETPSGLSTITAPSSMNAGASGAASVTNTAGLTFDWRITNGTINSGQGTNAINFTATTDPVTLIVTATNSQGCGISDSKSVTVNEEELEPPTNVVAAATTSTNVLVSWDAAVGAVTYRVYRSSNGITFSSVGTTASTSLNDSSAAADTAYLYVVVSRDAGLVESVYSEEDLATTVIFTDPTLTVQSTQAKVVHVTELRTAVNAVRALADLGTSSFTDSSLTTAINLKALHITELRTALNVARTALGLSAVSFTESSITAEVTTMKAAHINELRGGVQ